MIPREIRREPPDGQAEGQNANDGINQIMVPKINCQERIILCLDLSSEMSLSSLYNNQNRSVFQYVQKSMEIFVKSKLGLNRKHMFSIVTLEETAHWFQEFSCDVNLICDMLHQLSPNNTECFKTFDMTSILNIVENHVELPMGNDVDLPPDYVVRVIMIYGRSQSTIPSFSEEGKQMFDRYMASPYFFFDVLYVHELPDAENNCEAIYDAFCKLDEREVCFMFEVSRSITRLFDHTAKLLSHPLQRVRQLDINFKLKQDSDEDPDQ